MKRTLLLLVAAATVAALHACGSDGEGGEGADVAVDTAAPLDGGADAVAATDSHEGADAAGGPLFRCAVDADCSGAGEICTCEGECVVPEGAACTEDNNCGVVDGVRHWCSDCTGHCEAQRAVCQPCTKARECNQGSCVAFASGGNFCGLDCVTDVGCGVGYVCREVSGIEAKQCVPKSGNCLDLGICQDDGDCPDGEICNAAIGECGQGCVDGGCTVGQVCVLGRCVAPCASDDDCDAPATCTDDGKCKIPGSCETKADCPEPETHCDKVEGRCKDGCLADSDCGDAAKECESTQCVAKGCEHNYQCQFDHDCEQASGACVENTEPHCEPCGDSGSFACDDPNLCVTFKDEDDNPLGDFCLLPCKEDPIDKCPAGYQCQAAEIDGEDKHFCVRECHVDPVAIGSGTSG